MSLITEFTREAQTSPYTIDAMVVADDDTAYAVAYDAAAGSHLVMTGTREGVLKDEGICFTPGWITYAGLPEALEAVGAKVEGHDH